MTMLFIGGTGGSGTRIVSTFCAKAGYYIGNNLNKSLDAMHVEPFYRKYTRGYLEGSADEEEMKKALISGMNLHMKDNTNPMRAIKNPRSLLMLPVLHSVYPDMKFIHIIRGGVSMSFSGNRRHVRKYGDLFVRGSKIDGSKWSPELAMKVWAESNMDAFNYGTTKLKNNYLLLRYEHICSKKLPVYKELVKFIGCSEELIPAMMRKTTIPDTWKRGRKTQSKKLVRSLEEIGVNAMNNFGYNLVYPKGKNK